MVHVETGRLVSAGWGLIPSPEVRHLGREATLHDKCPSVHVLPEQQEVSSPAA